MKNFLPFVRHAKIELPVRTAGSLYRPIRTYTRLSDLGTGGFIRAHLQDAILAGDPLTEYVLESGRVKMRFGIHGRPYYTEGFYEARVYEDGSWPTYAVWNWQKPYRIYPGDFLRARIGTGGGRGVRGEVWPVGGVILNGVRVKDGRPGLIYAIDEVDTGTGRQITDQILDDVQLDCPVDSPIDLYSIALNLIEADAFGLAYPRMFELFDHNNRAICMKQDVRGWIQLRGTPILLGDDFILTPGETITFEFQPLEHDPQVPVVLDLFVRGVLEVEDGK